MASEKEEKQEKKGKKDVPGFAGCHSLVVSNMKDQTADREKFTLYCIVRVSRFSLCSLAHILVITKILFLKMFIQHCES